MASKIFTSDLKVVMFVADLDRPWVDTPFLLQGFLIDNEEQILALRTHCEYVMVDRARSTGAEFEAVRQAIRTPGKHFLRWIEKLQVDSGVRIRGNSCHKIAHAVDGEVKSPALAGLQYEARIVS